MSAPSKLAVGPLLPYFDFFPPFLCYALARRSGHVKRGVSKKYTISEMSERSGISERTFSRIAAKLTWDGVDMATASAFLHGCNVNPFRSQGQKEFIKKTMKMQRRFSHLRPSQVRDLEAKFAQLELMRAGV